MQPLIKFANKMLICHVDDSCDLPESFTTSRRSANFEHLVAWDVSADEDYIKSDLDFVSPRYLDRFYLWTRSFSDTHRQDILIELFEAAALEYEDLICVEQNQENITNLVTALSQSGLRAEPTILDFGCGVGLSTSLAIESRINLIGFDPCESMRGIALGRGLKVLSSSELEELVPESLDGAFASYVFHLLPDLTFFRRAWRKLKRSAGFAANFHKGVGINHFRAALVEEKYEEIILTPNFSNFQHGDYRIFIRK